MITNMSEDWSVQMDDLLEPNYTSDPTIFRESLEDMKIYGGELKKNLETNKTTFNVLAPYLDTVYKDQKKALSESAKNLIFSAKTKEAKLLLCDKKTKDQSFIGGIRHSDILDQYEMIVSIHETADVLQVLLKANTVITYLVDSAKNEFYQSSRHVISSMDTLTWKIEPGTTMAAYAAHTKQYVVSNNVHTDVRFPLGLSFSCTLVKYGLCVPIKTNDENIVAIYEITRDAFSTDFEPRDIQVVLALVGWMGFAIQYNILCTDLMHRLQLGDYLLQLTDHYHGGHADLYETLSSIATFARQTISAELCNFYLVEKETEDTSIIEEYSQENENSLFKKKRKKTVFRYSTSYLSQVLFGKVVVNKYETQLDISPHSDRIKLRSILCVAVVCKCGEVVGIIQLTNKKTTIQFTKNDEDVLKIFALSFAINLNCNMLQKSEKNFLNQKHMSREMLLYHMGPCNHDRELLKMRLGSLPNNFSMISWYPPQDCRALLPQLTLLLFREVLGDSFMRMNNVQEFILTARNCYRSNPYHNFIHAVNATHKMATILKHHGEIFSGLEQQSLMIAILCHNIDHHGLSNSFIKLTDHYLSKLYDSSPIENHIFAATKIILEKNGLFKYLDTDTYNNTLSDIYKCIKATDLSFYYQNRINLLRLADGKLINLKDSNHKHLIKNLVTISCVLSDNVVPFPEGRKITEEFYEELYIQGDLLKKSDLVLMPFMDRSQKDMIPENQIQFLVVILLPMLETLSQMFEIVSPLISDCKEVIRHWKMLIEVKHQETWRPEDSISKLLP